MNHLNVFLDKILNYIEDKDKSEILRTIVGDIILLIMVGLFVCIYFGFGYCMLNIFAYILEIIIYFSGGYSTLGYRP